MTTESIAEHGQVALSAVSVDSYNQDVTEGGDILNHRLRNTAFFELLDALRAPLRERGQDPLGKAPSAEIGRKQLEKHLASDDALAVRVMESAISAYGREIAAVLERFLKTKQWAGVARVAVGGGFRKGEIGVRGIEEAAKALASRDIDVELVPIRHHADDAGLIGAAHLVPSSALKGHTGMLAVDIGGTNLRVGVVRLNLEKAADLSQADVWESDIWRHADDEPKRTETIQTLVKMLRKLMTAAQSDGLDLVPIIGIGCPGVIDASGSIVRGGVNLPGGNWESGSFNLPAFVTKHIETIGDHRTLVVMHNDAVLQGLSQTSWMSDVKRWGIFTIGTGLGNACFTNRGA